MYGSILKDVDGVLGVVSLGVFMRRIGKGITAALLTALMILSGASCAPGDPPPKLIGPVDPGSNLFFVAADESYPIEQKTKEYFQSVGIPVEPRLLYIREGNQIAIYDSTNADNGFSVGELRIMVGVLDTLPLSVIEQVRIICLRPTDKIEITISETISDYRGLVEFVAEPKAAAKSQSARRIVGSSCLKTQKAWDDVLAKSQVGEKDFKEVLTHEIGHIFQMALMWYTGQDGTAKAERFAAIDNQYLNDPLSYLDRLELKFDDNIARPYGMNDPPYEDFATVFGAFFTDQQGLWDTAVRRANNGHSGLREKALFMSELFPQQADLIRTKP